MGALGNWLVILGRMDEAEPLFNEALTTLENAAELNALAEVMSRRAVQLMVVGRFEESTAVSRHARDLAEEHDLTSDALRATFTLAAGLVARDRHLQALPEVSRGVEIARERGDRYFERMLLAGLVQCQVFLGRWREAQDSIPELLGGAQDQASIVTKLEASSLAVATGDEALLERCVALAVEHREIPDLEYRSVALIVLAREALERDEPGQALKLLDPVLGFVELAGEIGTAAYALATDAAFVLGDDAPMSRVLAALDALSPVRKTPVRRAQRARLLAERAFRSADGSAAVAHEAEAVELLRSAGAMPLLAGALLDQVRRRGDAAAVAEARSIFAELGATRWLERLDPELGAVPA
jgi:tetratricopeptide (TPR) repeat protein